MKWKLFEEKMVESIEKTSKSTLWRHDELVIRNILNFLYLACLNDKDCTVRKTISRIEGKLNEVIKEKCKNAFKLINEKQCKLSEKSSELFENLAISDLCDGNCIHCPYKKEEKIDD